ncbi:YoaK family protein [Pasteurella testudinis]|uniref:YoaK family protein n=1 Tax=Pasteurella testudinis TaxID=761 RepID=UPI004059259C
MKSVLPQNMRLIAIPVAFCGGYLDVFTYLHYGTLVSAQTGNIIFMIADIGNVQSATLSLRLLSLFFFMLGVILGALIKSAGKTAAWRIGTLLPLIIASLLISLISNNGYPMQLLSVACLAAGAGIMTATFANIETYHFNMMFTTGNLRNAATGWTDYFANQDQQALKKGIDYTLIVAAFFTGALLSKYLYTLLNQTSLLLVFFVLTGIAIAYTVLVDDKNLEKSDISD